MKSLMNFVGIISLVLLLSLLIERGVAQESQSSNRGLTNAFEAFEDCTISVNALSGLLFELAGASHDQFVQQKKLVIMTAHHGKTVRAYTDGKYIVISIPFSNPSERAANALFCQQFNELTATDVDPNVGKGKIKEAAEFYRLRIKFERDIWKEKRWFQTPIQIPQVLESQGRATTAGSEEKLEILEKLLKGEATDENLQKYKDLCVAVAPLYKLSEINQATPTTVKSLMDLRIN
jgi:hypothetical protein